MHDREYGSLATLGIAVPQANPTVEPEMAALMPDKVAMLTTRLRGSGSSSKNRLVEYLDNFGDSLRAYDIAPLDAVGFGNTGTSYMVGAEDEERRLSAFSAEFGYPIVSAAQSIRQALEHIGAKKIALFAPYPAWLIEAGQKYWRQSGLTITDTATVTLDVSDTRNIYRVRTSTVLQAIAQLDSSGADAILLTGTGMPTLRAIPELIAKTGKPVLTSNLCLAWALLRAAGAGDALPAAGEGEFLYGGWRARLRA